MASVRRYDIWDMKKYLSQMHEFEEHPKDEIPPPELVPPGMENLQDYNLDQPLYCLADGAPPLFWTPRISFENTLIAGSVGSGKTTGSGAWQALSQLSVGRYGGLVLLVKDDLKLWLTFMGIAQRLPQVLIITPEDNIPYRLNFLQWMNSRAGNRGHVENIVEIFQALMDISEGGGGKENNSDPIWPRARAQILRNAVTLVKIATDDVNLPAIRKCIISAPTSHEMAASIEADNNYCYHLIAEADRRAAGTLWEGDVELAGSYFLNEYPSLSDRTRSSVVLEFTSMSDALLRYPLKQMFCDEGGSNYCMELAFAGCLIILHMPVLQYRKLARYAATLMKYLFQVAVSQRDEEAYPLPVMLWADESHHVVSPESDGLFASTAARSPGRCAFTYLVQSLPAYYSALGGGPQAKDTVDFLLGMFNNRFWHQQSACPVTNNNASEVIAKGIVRRLQGTEGYPGQQGAGVVTGPDGSPRPAGFQGTTSWSEQTDYKVQPEEFTTLLKGGPPHMTTEAIALLGGRLFPNGETWMRIRFPQFTGEENE